MNQWTWKTKAEEDACQLRLFYKLKSSIRTTDIGMATNRLT
jgi:hypothetical protein